MDDLFHLYNKLLRTVMPTLKHVEEAMNDKSMCPKSRLLAIRTILYNSDSEFQRYVRLYYERHIFELPEVSEAPLPSRKVVFMSYNFDGTLFLN